MFESVSERYPNTLIENGVTMLASKISSDTKDLDWHQRFGMTQKISSDTKTYLHDISRSTTEPDSEQ